MRWLNRPQIQALAPIGLSIQGAFVLAAQDDYRPQLWVIVALVGAMGMACWMQLLPRPPLSLGAIVILIGGFILFLNTGGTRSLFMPWYFVLVAVYPLVVPRPYRRALPAVAAGAYLALIPFTSPAAPPELVPTRVFIILLIGYLTLALGERSRRAEESATRRLRYEKAVAEATRLLNEGEQETTIQAALQALLDGTESRSVFVERNVEVPELGPCTTLIYEASRPNAASPSEDFWTEVPWSSMPQAFAHLEAGETFAFRTEDLEGTERSIYEESGIKAEIDLPVFVDGEWYGLIGISDDLIERSWDEDDIALLQAAASAIGAFLERRTRRLKLEDLALSRAKRIEFERAIASSARILLMSETDKAIDGTLQTLGSVMQAQKILVDENSVDEHGRLCARVTHEFIKPEFLSSVEPDIEFDPVTGRFEHHVFCYDDYPDMRDRLAAGYDVEVFPEASPNAIEIGYEGAVKAELNIPIFVSDHWVGSVRFGNYVEARDWKHDEKRLLHTVAAMIGAFWERNESRLRLEELIRSKDEFVASVSHELRTPLTAVVGLAHELRQNGTAFERTEVEELIALIADQSVDVANIVEDLLVAARAETGALTVITGEVDLAAETRTVLTGKGILPKDRDSIEVDGTAPIAWADGTRVRQILRNLLTNAVRYGGDRVRITFGGETHTATVAVHDSGDPIPPEAQHRIFRPYQRAHDIPTQPASVGLGLSVSLQLAELMDGSLAYEYRDGESVFTLTLPAARHLQAVP